MPYILKKKKKKVSVLSCWVVKKASPGSARAVVWESKAELA